MANHLYLSLMPEALIASMLGPEDFGSYYSVGDAGTAQGQAAFFEIDPSFRDPAFPIDAALARCVPHTDGRPKHTVYIAAYRVLERIPLPAIGKLFLATRDGRTLALDRAAALPPDETGLHFYHELAPTRPQVVSTLGSRAFGELIVGEGGPFPALPAIAFAELRLGELGDDPENGAVGDLPYENIRHLRSVLAALKKKSVATKIFERSGSAVLSYRTIRNGFFVCKAKEAPAYYDFPKAEGLRAAHRDWWRSANL
jgi:hypothetical protein